MILSSRALSPRYVALHPLFPRIFDYIHATDLYALAPGRYPLQGEELIAIVEQVSAKTKEVARLECHRRYIDIQLVLEGDETMGWKPLADCHNPVAEFSAERDIQFFTDAPASYVPVPPGHFCIFFPEDAHAPLVGSGTIRKVIFKIAI
ncbi:MAG: YhcH/YjgK/YiaL family protein [Nitrosomonadales bacterium]|nr:YhcH/YjgK/YiaL family protein [Nitrosomonadales bacterium]